MNDADVQLPAVWSEKTLLPILALVERTTIKTTANNADQIGHGQLVVLRDIAPGEEVTKSYGVAKWVVFLAVCHLKTPDQRIMLGNVAQKLGYNFFVAGKSNQI